jgi:hypothetical protein
MIPVGAISTAVKRMHFVDAIERFVAPKLAAAFAILCSS